MHMRSKVAIVLCTSAVTTQGRTEPRKGSKIFTLVKSKGKIAGVVLGPGNENESEKSQHHFDPNQDNLSF